MLNLDSISFSADTSQLDLAAKKIESLGTALSALSVDLNKLDKASSTAAKSQQTIAKAAEDAAKASKTKADADDQSTKAVKENTSVLERQQQILEFMTQGFSKGQSSTLAYAKSTGILTEDLKELQSVLQSQRTLTGGDPFDKSLGALKSLQNEFKVLKEVQRLYTAEIPITQKQMENLALDKLRLIEAMKIEGKSMTDIKNAIRDLNADYIGLATNINRISAADDALVKSNQDSAKAMGFLSREMERVDNVITGFNNNLNVTSSNRLLKFREQLKASGVDAVTAANMLKTYEDRLKTINATGATNSKNKREDELKYLARATSVQLGDIGISLAGGQNPLLVLIQQGDQLRGVLNQVGASGNEMQKALSMAFSQIVVGAKDVVVALGSFVVGAFADTGKAVIGAVNNFTGLGNTLEVIKYKLTLARNEGVAYSGAMLTAFNVLGTVISTFVAVSIAGLAVGLAGLAIGYYKVIKENDELAKSLALTGGALSISQTTALSYVKTLGTMGVTTGDATTAIVEMAKAGNITSDSILMIGKAAVDMEKYAKVPIADTVKQFSELEKKPVEALIAIAKATGLVSPEVLRLVTEFDRQGKSSEAAAVAMKEYAKVTEQQIASMKSNYSEFSLFIIKAGDTISQFFSKAFKAVAIAANPLDAAADQMKKLDERISETKANMSSVDKLGFSFFKSDDSLLKKLEAERLSLSKFIKLQQEKNDAEEISKETNVNNAKAQEYLNNLREKHMKTEVKAQNELTELLEKKKKLLAEGNLSNAADLKIMDEAIKKQEKIIADANKPKKVPKSEAEKGIESYVDIVNKANGLTSSYNNELSKLQAARAKGVITEQQYIQAVEELIQQQPFYIAGLKEIVDNEKALEKLIHNKLKIEQELGKIKDENSKFLEKEQLDIDKATNSSKMKLELLGKTADEQFTITEQYRLQNQLSEIGLRFDERRRKLKSEFDKVLLMPDVNIEKVKSEYEDALNNVNAKQKEAVDSAMSSSANSFEVHFAEKILKVGATLSDAITTALFEGGQAGTKKLKDYIVGIFRDKINVSINAVVNTVLGGMFGGSKGSAGGGSGGQSSGLSSMFGGSTGSIFSNFGGKASDWISDIGGSLINSGSESLGDLGATLVSNSTAIGQFASYAGDALGYLNAIDKWSKGQRGAAVGSAIGTYFGGPVGAAIGDALGGMLDYKVEDKGGGITATIGGASGLPSGSVGRYKEFEQKGGLFGGGTTTNREWSVADQGIATYITKNVKAITEVNKIYGKSIGLTSDTITNFTKSIEVNTTGMDAAAAQAAIDAELVKFSSEQIAATYGASIKDVAREGETTADTLKRLGTDLTGVNSMFGTLGYTLYDVSVTGAAAASTLANAFGGLAAAQQQLNGYYENFYSQTEQEANIYNAVKTDLANAGMNFTVDQLRAATKGDIRSAVDSLAGDVGTEQGANRYAAAVKAANKLAGLKTTETKTPEGPTGPLPGTAEYYKPGGDVSSGAVSAGDKAADSIANAWQSITDSIWGEVKRIRGLLQESSGNALEIAQQQFNEATAAARSGDQEAAKALPELSKVLLTISQGQASTLIELRRAQALTANSLEQTVTGLASTYGLTVPAFAGGGSYAGGMALVGEQGPELINFNQGGYVHTAGQTASMLGGSGELVSEIRRLNAKVDQLEAAAVSTAISNSKIYKILERVTPNGTTVEVSGTVTAI